jgi:hypothetical protein
MVADINTFLGAAGSINLHDTVMHKDPDDGGVTILISYTSPGLTQFLAYGWVSTNATPADSLANTFFAYNPTIRGVQILDVSPELRNQLYRDAVIAITAPAMWSECGNTPQRMRIVSADADILAGDTGLCSLVTEIGTITTDKVLVKNLFDFTWVASHLGWAAVDPTSCEWQGFSTCC